MNTVDFGKFVTELRKEKGFTQKQLAEMLDVTDKAVSRWETGKNYPDIEMFERLSAVFGVTVSELLEGKRIPKENLNHVSEVQVIEQIKNNKRSKKRYRIIIAVVLVIVLLLGYIVLKDNGYFDGVIYNHIDCYSDDVLTILNNVDGYISQRPKADGDYIIDWGWIFLDTDKTTDDLYLNGTCENGRSFYVNTLYNESGYCFIGEMRKNSEPVQGVPIDELKSLVAQLDFSDFQMHDKYHLRISGIADYKKQDLYVNEFQASIKKYIFQDGILQKYTEKTLTGKYVLLEFSAVQGSSMHIKADIYYKL